MENIKISEAEYPLMEYIWEHAPIAAAELAAYAGEAFGWKKNTTYTVIKRLILRGAIERGEPGFIVTPLVSREAVRKNETDNLINRIYDGSRKLFLTSFVDRKDITPEELELLKEALNKLDDK